jgi:hypothetical protein
MVSSSGKWNPTENCFLITYHFIHHVGVLGHTNWAIVKRPPTRWRFRVLHRRRVGPLDPSLFWGALSARAVCQIILIIFLKDPCLKWNIIENFWNILHFLSQKYFCFFKKKEYYLKISTFLQNNIHTYIHECQSCQGTTIVASWVHEAILPIALNFTYLPT